MSIELYQALQTTKRIDIALLEAQKVDENNSARYEGAAEKPGPRATTSYRSF
ncbi:MAG: hypothetical protein Q8S19_10710 [Bacillota bacterium]|nr:hypothetical protein [Bacillota bacterium]